jgi:hypothetical protein
MRDDVSRSRNLAGTVEHDGSTARCGANHPTKESEMQLNALLTTAIATVAEAAVGYAGHMGGLNTTSFTALDAVCQLTREGMECHSEWRADGGYLYEWLEWPEGHFEAMVSEAERVLHCVASEQLLREADYCVGTFEESPHSQKYLAVRDHRN